MPIKSTGEGAIVVVQRADGHAHKGTDAPGDLFDLDEVENFNVGAPLAEPAPSESAAPESIIPGLTSNSQLLTSGRSRPKMAIFREQGINGQNEMGFAFDRAGFQSVDVHMTDLLSGRVDLKDFAGALMPEHIWGQPKWIRFIAVHVGATDTASFDLYQDFTWTNLTQWKLTNLQLTGLH